MGSNCKAYKSKTYFFNCYETNSHYTFFHSTCVLTSSRLTILDFGLVATHSVRKFVQVTNTVYFSYLIQEQMP